MSNPITNIHDLRAEIARLKVVKDEQEVAIKAHFASPTAIINTLFSGSGAKGKGGFLNPDELISMASRFILPLLLNKTIFRGSNFVVKAIVGLLSQSAAGFINEKNLTSTWDKIKSLIPEKWTKKGKEPKDYGIPPLSESY